MDQYTKQVDGGGENSLPFFMWIGFLFPKWLYKHDRREDYMICIKEGKLAPAYNTLYVFDPDNIYEIYFRADHDVVDDFVRELDMPYNPGVMAYDSENEMEAVFWTLDEWRRTGVIDDYFETVDYKGENLYSSDLIVDASRKDYKTDKTEFIGCSEDIMYDWTDIGLLAYMYSYLPTLRGIDALYDMIYDPDLSQHDSTEGKIILCQDGIVYPKSI